MKHSHKSPFPRRKSKKVPLSGPREASFEEFSRKLKQLSQLPPPTAGPKLFKEGPGGTLEQVGREADAAWAGVKRIMDLINVESKTLDYQVQVTTSWTGNVLNCSSITQGVADNQRTGDSLRVQRFRARIMVAYATASTILTIVVGRSKDALPVIGDIFETFGSGYSGINFENHDQRKADQILHMRHVAVDNVAHPMSFVEIDFKCPDLPTTYANGTATTTANTYWAALICGAASGPVVNWNSRLDFVDN